MLWQKDERVHGLLKREGEKNHETLKAINKVHFQNGPSQIWFILLVSCKARCIWVHMNMHIYKNGYCPPLYQKGSSLNTIYVMLLACVEALFAEMIYMRTLSQFDKILSMALASGIGLKGSLLSRLKVIALDKWLPWP